MVVQANGLDGLGPAKNQRFTWSLPLFTRHFNVGAPHTSCPLPEPVHYLYAMPWRWAVIKWMLKSSVDVLEA